jgi:ABC-type multidrug transport system fused ATPase/permease subunit
MGPRGAIRDFGKQKAGKAFDIRIVMRLLAYLRPYWLRMAIAITLVLISAALTLSVPYLLKVAIDQSIAHSDIAGLTRIALVLMAVFVAIYVTTAILQYVLSWVGDQVLATLRAQLFRHLQLLPLGYHDTHIVGVTISRVINDVSVINDLLSQGLITFIEDAFVLVGIIVVMLSLSLRLALITFTVLPLMIFATWLFARQAQAAFRQTRNRIAEVIGNLAENITGIRVIQAFAQEETSQERFDEVNGANRDANVAAMTLSFLFLPAVEFLGMLATGIVLWFGGLAVTHNQLTIGVVVAFLAYVTRFFDPIQELSQLYTTMQSAMAGGERVLELLDTPPDVRDAPNAPEMPPIVGRIELAGVSFAYRDDAYVLHELNLVIEPGQTIALVGPTGAGKSSIANLIARLYDVTKGAVLI